MVSSKMVSLAYEYIFFTNEKKNFFFNEREKF